MYSFYVYQEINADDLKTKEESTGYTPWMLSTPYSVKLLSSFLWTEAFRNTRNGENHEALGKDIHFHKILWGTKEYTFSHWTEHTQSVRLKAVLQCEFKAWKYIRKISEFQMEQEKSHTLTHTHTYTHTKCWYTVRYLVSKFLNFHLLNYNIEPTRSHWTLGHPGALHQFSQS
jgi:hypothetical protein